jgi:hypothetical protein
MALTPQLKDADWLDGLKIKSNYLLSIEKHYLTSKDT